MENFKKHLFFESEKLIFALVEQKFIYIHVFAGAELEIEDVVELVTVGKKVIHKDQYPLLIDFGYGASISSEARVYAADRSKRFSSADAIVIKSFAQRLIMNFYIRFHKPMLPTGIFKEKEEAMEWIKQFVKP